MVSRVLLGMALLAVLACPAAVQGDVVVYSQPCSTEYAIFSDLSRFTEGYFAADDFELADECRITDVHWWGVYLVEPPPDDDFTIEFYEDVSGSPAMDPFESFNVGPVTRQYAEKDLVTQGGGVYKIYGYSCYLTTPVDLSGGTRYYLSVYNNTEINTDDDWVWMSAGTPTGTEEVWWRDSQTMAWALISTEPPYIPRELVAFKLTGTVIPEPVSSLLFVGSVGLGLLWRKRHRAA